MGEQWLLKCCNATLSLALVSEQTKDSFGEGEDMEMHNGDTGGMWYSLSLSLQSNLEDDETSLQMFL